MAHPKSQWMPNPIPIRSASLRCQATLCRRIAALAVETWRRSSPAARCPACVTDQMEIAYIYIYYVCGNIYIYIYIRLYISISISIYTIIYIATWCKMAQVANEHIKRFQEACSITSGIDAYHQIW